MRARKLRTTLQSFVRRGPARSQPDRASRWSSHQATVYGLGAALLLFVSVIAMHLCRFGAGRENQALRSWASHPPSTLTGGTWDAAELNRARQRRKNYERKKRLDPDNLDSDLPQCTPSPLESQDSFPMFGCGEMEEMLSGPTKYLGQGYWRDVKLATYDGRQFAVKTLRDNHNESRRNKERHRWEAVALDAVKDHPNIVHLLGLCECDIITEYFPVHMDELLLLHGNSHEPLPDRDAIRMALGAARGLQALHEAPGGPIVHADLQPRQLLIDENGVVKLNDLNRCRFMGRDAAGDPCPFRISKANGVWRSPEEFAGEAQTEKLDIFSMGMIFWAMFGRRPPFERDEKDRYKDMLLAGVRPYVDSSWHQDFVQLFRDMWADDPRDRPSARETAERLERMLAELGP